MINLFGVFKVGIGPSLSYTIGSMKAGKQFVDDLVEKGLLDSATRVAVDVYGSLPPTGKGHYTDVTIIMGLAGNEPATVDIGSIPSFIRDVEERKHLLLAQGRHKVDFPRDSGTRSHNGNLLLYENGMQIHTYNGDEVVYGKIYYSTGGGFTVGEEHFGQDVTNEVNTPYPLKSTAKLFAYCNEASYSLSSLATQSELALYNKEKIDGYFACVWWTMQARIDRGISTEGVLPDPLRVPRRALTLRRMLVPSDKLSNDPMNVIDWVNVFALAANKENAAGGRVVAAPTNGACGIVSAVLAYYDHFIESVSPDIYTRYFMVAGAIGILYKVNASTSGAEVGYQDEIGAVCSMAAADLAELLDGSPEQIHVATEVGMEHSLGLTCDPVVGQVQVPCIERNVIAPTRTINTAWMALCRISALYVSLDKVIEAMYETGKSMNAKYRGTPRGGLAAKVRCD